MYKKLLLICLLGGILVNCKKGEELNPTECLIEIHKLFKDQIGCESRENIDMSVHIFQGTYEGQEIYFTLLVCPNCNTLPPEWGYNCKKEKVEIKNFLDVKNMKKIYDSCTGKFI